MNDNWEYGAQEKIDQKILDDYESEEFDIGDIADDYDLDEFSEEAVGEHREATPFLNPDEKLKDWDFGGMQVEKHSKRAKKHRGSAPKEAD